MLTDGNLLTRFTDALPFRLEAFDLAQLLDNLFGGMNLYFHLFRAFLFPLWKPVQDSVFYLGLL